MYQSLLNGIYSNDIILGIQDPLHLLHQEVRLLDHGRVQRANLLIGSCFSPPIIMENFQYNIIVWERKTFSLNII